MKYLDPKVNLPLTRETYFLITYYLILMDFGLYLLILLTIVVINQFQFGLI
jgi:hypothetical protein